MKKILALSVLAMCVSHSAVAANYALGNDNIALSFDDANSTVVVKDNKANHPLTPQELFFLTLPVFTFFLGPLASVSSRKHEFEADEFAVLADGTDDFEAGHARFAHQRGKAMLQHACADAAEHVAGAALLNDDGINTRLVQQCAEQQARGACTNDGNLGSHVSLPRDGTLMGVNKQ